MDVNTVWLGMIQELANHGAIVKPRGQVTHELLAYQTTIDMLNPVVTVKGRRLGRRFLSAEAAWILDGDNRVVSISSYSKEISKFSDDGLTFRGAYGPRYVDQVGYVVEALKNDPETRQAVMTLWRERPGPSKDVPCTTSLQWLVRDTKLHCVATMRSSDAWLGWVYDVHAFSAMTAHLLLSLRHGVISGSWHDVSLGYLHLTAGSQHLYERNTAAAVTCLNERHERDEPWQPLPLEDLSHPDELVDLLWERASHDA